MSTLVSAVLWLGGGLLLGWCIICSQVATVAHLHPHMGRAFVWRIAGGLFFRWSMAAAALTLALRWGLAPALWLLCGFWLMRMLMIYRIHQGRAFQRQLRS